MSKKMKDLVIFIRGAGDIASGVAHRLHSSGMKRILMLERENPVAVRREVSFCEAVYDGEKYVEGVKAVRVESFQEAKSAWERKLIPVMVDPDLRILEELKPDVLIDGILAKRNTGTKRGMADLVIGLGPGFTAGFDVDFVVETNRGHNLGKVIRKGSAEPDTGKPAEVMGYSEERVLRAPKKGIFTAMRKIGDPVRKGEVVATVDGSPVYSKIDGVLRGILRDGIEVYEGFKCGDVDPRGIIEYCYTISDKARAVGGGVLEAILSFFEVEI